MNINEYPIIILHGWGSSSKRWEAVRGQLERQGYRVYIPDLPGFGDEPPPPKPWSVSDYAHWVKDFADKNNLQKFFLVGHSFGGATAAVFAAQYPQMVERLILVSAALRRQKKAKQRIFLAISKISKAFFSPPLCSKLYPLAQKALYKLAGVNDYITPTIQKSPVMKETFRKIISEDLVHILPKIVTPTLIVWGEMDFVTPLSHGRLIQQKISGAKLEIISGADHNLNIKAPEKLSEVIAGFLNHES